MSFFDIDDILASQQRIQCVFEQRVPKLGFLDANYESDAIEEGAKMDLPSWLARELHKNQHVPIVSVEMPKCYGSICRTILDADAHVVDLNKLGPYFYAAGKNFISCNTPEMHELGKMLIQAFSGRFRWIMEKGMNAAEEKQQLMDKTELKIYAAAQACAKSYTRWLSRESELLSASDDSISRKKLKTGN